jgi:hypothetical protein
MRGRLDFQLQNLPVPPQFLARIHELLAQRKNIQAIKELRKASGLGLKDAKDLVDAIERGHIPPVPPGFEPERMQTDLADRVRRLRDSGREMDAVQLVCDETGMRIVDAQTFVRSLS